ncbi:MAG: hypothetical protein WBG86_05295, partial [Polyangiales bacterium]
ELEIPPEVILAGLEHGSKVNTDLIGDASWDPWDHFATPIEDVRRTLDIRPRGREADYLEYDEAGNIKVTV